MLPQAQAQTPTIPLARHFATTTKISNPFLPASTFPVKSVKKPTKSPPPSTFSYTRLFFHQLTQIIHTHRHHASSTIRRPRSLAPYRSCSLGSPAAPSRHHDGSSSTPRLCTALSCCSRFSGPRFARPGCQHCCVSYILFTSSLSVRVGRVACVGTK